MSTDGFRLDGLKYFRGFLSHMGGVSLGEQDAWFGQLTSCHWPVMLLLYVIMLVSNYAKWIHDFGARLCYHYASIIGYATLTFTN